MFLDTPGHKDFVPKMISGAAQAEFAILLIDGIPTAFESGIGESGQTREHVQLLNALGVRKVIIAVNKMDVSGWDRENYEYIVAKTSAWMDSQNFKNIESRQFIPIAALAGHNITSSPHKDAPGSNWWQGPCLVQVFDNLESKCLEDLRKPFRLLIGNCYSSTGHTKKGFLIAGNSIQKKPHRSDHRRRAKKRRQNDNQTSKHPSNSKRNLRGRRQERCRTSRRANRNCSQYKRRWYRLHQTRQCLVELPVLCSTWKVFQVQNCYIWHEAADPKG